MRELVLILVGLLSLIPTFVSVNVNATTAEDDPDTETNENDFAEIRESCYDQGVEDGKNSPFSRQTYNHCGDDNSGGDDAYLEGFVNGCMDVAGNSKEMCNSATD